MIRLTIAAALLAGAAPLAAATHEIAAGDGAQDKLQEVLITAQPGDEIVLGAGRFVLTDGLSLDVAHHPLVSVTADGHLFFCLYATAGLDIRTPLRDGASDDDLATLIASAWRDRSDRGAEARLLAPDRSVFIAVDDLRRSPQLEMHTRGG